MTDNFDYSVRVKNGAGWRNFSRVRLMISVGQEYHEQGKFRAVVDWINRNDEIKEVHISVNDYLQRHNYYALGFSNERANAIALVEGSLWLGRNEDAISDIKAKVITTRWNDWFDNEKYLPARRQISLLRETNQEFSLAVRSDAERNIARRIARGEKVPEDLTCHSLNYLQEELAVFALQTFLLPAAEVYPGSNLTSAEYCFGKVLPQEIAPLSQRYFTRIDFARINVQPVLKDQISLNSGV